MFFNLRLNGYLRMETYDGGGSSGVFEVHGEGTFSVKLSRAIPLAWKTGNRSGYIQNPLQQEHGVISLRHFGNIVPVWEPGE